MESVFSGPRRWLAALGAAAGALAVAFFVLWACQIPLAFHPMATLHPAARMAPGERGQVGIAGQGLGLPVCPQGGGFCFTGGSGQLWFGYHVIDRIEIGFDLFAGFPNAFGGAFTARGYLLDEPSLRLGVEAEAGWLYGAVGIPIAVQAGETFWIYTDPSASLGLLSGVVFRLPVGFAVRVAGPLTVVGELGVILVPLATSPGLFTPPTAITAATGPLMFTGSLGLALTF